MSVKVKFPNASIKSIKHKQGKVEVTFVAPHDDADATIADLNEMSLGEQVFKGTVTITGKAIQVALDFSSGRPGPTGEKE